MVVPCAHCLLEIILLSMSIREITCACKHLPALWWRHFPFCLSEENHGVIESMYNVMVVIKWPFLCISTNWLLKCFWCCQRGQRSMSGLLVYIVYFYQKTKIKAIEEKKKKRTRILKDIHSLFAFGGHCDFSLAPPRTSRLIRGLASRLKKCNSVLCSSKYLKSKTLGKSTIHLVSLIF